MKIAFISLLKTYSWGGSEELWAQVATHALSEGNEILVSVKYWETLHPKKKILMDRGAKFDFRDHPIPNSNIFSRAIKKVKRKFSNTSTGWDSLVSFKPDVVCISSGGTYDIVDDGKLTDVLRRYNFPYILINQLNYENFPLPDKFRERALSIFQKARKICFVAKRNLITAERNLVTRLTNAVVVSNPVNMAGRDIIPMPDSKEEILFASVARLDSLFKGQDILLEIFSSDKWKSRKWKLNFYGAGPDEHYLRQLVAFYGLENRVVFNGNVTDIEKVWAANHIQLMPSFAEGTPLALVEAMICGRPAVVTNVGDNAALIDDSVNGYVAESQALESFDRALEKAWENRMRFEELGRNAHKKAMDHIDFSSYLKIYGYLSN